MEPDRPPRRRLLRVLRIVLTLVLVALMAHRAFAHDSPMSFASVQFDGDGGFELTLQGDIEAMLSGVGPTHSATASSHAAAIYERLRALPPELLATEVRAASGRLAAGLNLRFDGIPAPLVYRDVAVPPIGDVAVARLSTVTFDGRVPAGAVAMTWMMSAEYGDSVVRALRPGETAAFHSEFAAAGTPSPPISVKALAPQPVLSVFMTYLVVGFEHIVPKGLDHILFVIGLFLLSPRIGALLWQVTGFTIAHSISLALAMLGVVSVSPSIVEPLIAASIVYVAIENTMTDKLHRWRPLLVFGFGLLHGLGFAGVLAEIGLSRAHFATGLIGFNLGVELGQLAVIAACFLAVGIWFQSKSWYRRAITVPASLAIAAVATFWFVERVI